MDTTKRMIAALEIVLIIPAALFMTALVVRSLQPAQQFAVLLGVGGLGSRGECAREQCERRNGENAAVPHGAPSLRVRKKKSRLSGKPMKRGA